LPREARTLRGWALGAKCLRGIVPSLGLIFLVLGTIFLGLATPTEAGAMGAVGAIALALFNRTLSLALLYQGMAITMRITAMVVFILIGARVFSLVFQGVGGKVWIETWLTALPGGQIGFLLFVNFFIFVIAFFLDFFEIAFIIIPLLAPVAAKLGIDLVWFGVLICANMQTSFMHPPFGLRCSICADRAASIKSSDIYWGAVPWVCLQLILVLIWSSGPVRSPIGSASQHCSIPARSLSCSSPTCRRRSISGSRAHAELDRARLRLTYGCGGFFLVAKFQYHCGAHTVCMRIMPSQTSSGIIVIWIGACGRVAGVT
jgi:hypothetical protein